MSVSYIPESVKFRLWGKAAGRCQYEGCNVALWKDSLTSCEFNTAYIAHIYADSPGGPRYHLVKSEELKSDISNLMLMCDAHHRLVDKIDVAGHPVDRLVAMKQAHEERIERVGAIRPELHTEVIRYAANVGAHNTAVSFEEARAAIVPARYPSSSAGIAIGLKNSNAVDRESSFWAAEVQHLVRAFDRHVQPLLAQGSGHFSLFAVAPQPLLMLLGSFLSDLHPVDVYQLHREPVRTWQWDNNAVAPDAFNLVIRKPEAHHTIVAVVLGVSYEIALERVRSVLGADVSIWSLALSEPSNDALRTKAQLEEFRTTARSLMAQINLAHPGIDCLHVFPAVPVAAAVEFGRVHMPKADPPLRIYDEQRGNGGFVYALSVPST